MVTAETGRTASDRAAGVIVLHRVPYRTYVRLRSAPENDHLRMTYHDGVLELMSPAYPHERGGSLLGIFVRVLAVELDLFCTSSRCTTFRRKGDGPVRGHGKEPDESFYIAHEPMIRHNKELDLDAGDPPPDLWIEVDHRASSKGKLPVYAALGVPEVWRYRAKTRTLRFLALNEQKAYHPIERSLALPMVTPALVLTALAMADGLADSTWERWLRDWIRQGFPIPS